MDVRKGPRGDRLHNSILIQTRFGPGEAARKLSTVRSSLPYLRYLEMQRR